MNRKMHVSLGILILILSFGITSPLLAEDDREHEKGKGGDPSLKDDAAGRASAPKAGEYQKVIENLTKRFKWAKDAGVQKFPGQEDKIPGAIDFGALEKIVKTDDKGKWIGGFLKKSAESCSDKKEFMKFSDHILNFLKKNDNWFNKDSEKTFITEFGAGPQPKKRNIDDYKYKYQFKSPETNRAAFLKEYSLVRGYVKAYSTKHKMKKTDPQYQFLDQLQKNYKDYAIALGLSQKDLDDSWTAWVGKGKQAYGYNSLIEPLATTKEEVCKFQGKLDGSGGPPGGTGTRTSSTDKTQTRTGTGTQTRTQTGTGTQTRTRTGTGTGTRRGVDNGDFRGAFRPDNIVNDDFDANRALQEQLALAEALKALNDNINDVRDAFADNGQDGQNGVAQAGKAGAAGSSPPPSDSGSGVPPIGGQFGGGGEGEGDKGEEDYGPEDEDEQEIPQAQIIGAGQLAGLLGAGNDPLAQAMMLNYMNQRKSKVTDRKPTKSIGEILAKIRADRREDDRRDRRLRERRRQLLRIERPNDPRYGRRGRGRYGKGNLRRERLGKFGSRRRNRREQRRERGPGGASQRQPAINGSATSGRQGNLGRFPDARGPIPAALGKKR